MINRLFVYGTLAPGEPNAHVLADMKGTWQGATIRGRLLEQGWGAALGYPGVILGDGGDEVPGQLFSSDELAGHWSRLDEFEGPGYERVVASVKLEDGSELDAQLYVLSETPDL